MIDEIIGLINDGFKGLHQTEVILGVAQSIHRIKSEVVEFMPGVVKLGTDEAVYAGIDDINSIIIYHKTNTSTLAFSPTNNRGGGYGDSRHNEDSVQCSAFALWDTRAIKINSADMLLLLRSRMPQQVIGVPGIKNVNIVVTSASLNSKQIFDSEYSLEEKYLLPVYIKLIQINYTIQLKYDPSCVNKCIDC